MASPELPRGTELVGIDASDFERPGELMLTIAHPANVERIVTPARPGEESPRSPETVSMILFREPFHGVEKGEGTVYATADSLGPDLLERMARTGKLAREGGSPLIGTVAAEAVPNRPARNPMVFAPLKNRVGVAPVKVEAAPQPKAQPIPIRPEAEDLPRTGSPVASPGGEGQEEASGKAKTEFPSWLLKKDDGPDPSPRPVQAAPAAPAVSAKANEAVTAQRAGTKRADVRLTVPTTGPAPWATSTTREAARKATRARQEALPSAFQSLNLATGFVVLGVGVAALVAALVLGRQGTVMDLHGYYRWERDALAQEVRFRRERHERGMQQQKDLRRLELEDRELGNLSRMVEVLDERSKK